jgi:hypothetical protein
MTSQDSEAAREQRIRERARRMWREDGSPEGQEAEYHERARELQAIEDNPGAGQLPNPLGQGDGHPHPLVEEAALQENLGEFPSRLTDQGDRQQTPLPRVKPE